MKGVEAKPGAWAGGAVFWEGDDGGEGRVRLRLDRIEAQGECEGRMRWQTDSSHSPSQLEFLPGACTGSLLTSTLAALCSACRVKKTAFDGAYDPNNSGG